jgi:hypothetical protein
MIDHVMRSRDGMKIHVVELFDPLGIEYCTFWFYSVVEKARHLFITLPGVSDFRVIDVNGFFPCSSVSVPTVSGSPILVNRESRKSKRSKTTAEESRAARPVCRANCD